MDAPTPHPLSPASPTPTDELLTTLLGVLSTALPEAHGDLEARVRPALALALRQHTASQDERWLRAERLIHTGQQSAGVAHELRNPLAVIETSVFILNECCHSDTRALRHLKRISEQVGIASQIVNELLETTRDAPLHRVMTPLATMIREAIGQVPRPPEVTLRLEPLEDLSSVVVDARRIRQVLINLVSNAYQSVEPGGFVQVSVDSEDHHIRIMVRDNGHGIPAELLPRLFEPLVTGRERGVGLGLALSRQIAERHGGTLTAANTPGGGAEFTLTLPRAHPSVGSSG